MHRRLNWLLMLATLAAAFTLYAIKYDTRRLEARVQAQERALEKAEADVAILAAERAYLARPERLEPLARLIGLAPIAPVQYLRLDAPPYSPQAGGEAANVPSPLGITPSPVAPQARQQNVGEGRGGGDRRTVDVELPPTPSASPRRVEDAPSARRGGEARAER
jgi:cell division protein FtsL